MNTPTAKMDYAKEILALKETKNAVILAHYYQEEAIQEIADFVGDSLALSKKAANTDADIIVFAGVHFMAETAKILNPNKKVLLPDLEAGCSLAESCTATDFKAFREKHPNHIAITYINCSADVKTLSDIICTSSNAKKIIESIPKEQAIIFAPDRNLGKYLASETGRELLLWDGACVVHEAFSFEKLLALHKKHPNSKIIAHPESESHILKVANFIGSTLAMIEFVKKDPCNEFLIATEVGILHKMMQEVPNKTLIPVPSKEDNTCACSECAYMKVNTMEKLYKCLLNESPEIILSDNVIQKAIIPLNRMLSLSN
ncbi:MAG: quinolinate synthase NadA [Bacteroidetes bacterium]|nr:quinolinate synthase NadA [Bacteroidota bacterium]